MCRELLHIYGPLSIHSYGLTIFIGLVVIITMMLCDSTRKRILNRTQLLDAITFALFSGIIGARLLHVLCNIRHTTALWDVIAIWDGGLSLMGAVVGILVGLPLYLWHINVPIILFLDLLVIYAPLLQAFGRIGCFLTGCCYGVPTAMPWGICYRAEDPELPSGIYLHPTQLYSSALLFILFLFLYARRIYTKPGQLAMLYLIFVSLERFIIDFLRGDREFFHHPNLHFLSIHQYCALFLIGIGLLGYSVASRRQAKVYEYI